MVRGGNKITSKNHQSTLVFNKVKCDVTESGNFYSVTGTTTLLNASSLYEDLNYSFALNVANEILIKFFQDSDEVPYDFYDKMIENYLAKKDVLTSLFIFVSKCTSYLGIEPNIRECVNCASKHDLVRFDLEEGGLICKRCAAEMGLEHSNINYMKIFRYAYLVDKDTMGSVDLPKKELEICYRDLLLFLENQFYPTRLNSNKMFLDILGD